MYLSNSVQLYAFNTPKETLREDGPNRSRSNFFTSIRRETALVFRQKNCVPITNRNTLNGAVELVSEPSQFGGLVDEFFTRKGVRGEGHAAM